METSDFERIYEFTPEEERLVEEARRHVIDTVSFIVRLHQLKGDIALTEDCKGLLAKRKNDNV